MAKRKKSKHRKNRSRSRRVGGDPRLAPPVISGMRRGKKGRKRKRSKVGAMDEATSTLLGAALGVGAGIAIDKFITPMVANFAPAYADKITDGIKLAGGAILATSKKSNKMMKGAGIGLLASGITTGAHNFGLVSGMDQFISGQRYLPKNDTMTIRMNGVEYNSTQLMNGSNQEQPPVISGEGDQYQISNSPMPSVISGQ